MSKKIIYLYFDDVEKEFIQNTHSHCNIGNPLYFVSSLDELENHNVDNDHIMISERFADQNLSGIRGVLDAHPQITVIFVQKDAGEMLSTHIFGLIRDYPERISSDYLSFILDRFED